MINNKAQQTADIKIKILEVQALCEIAQLIGSAANLNDTLSETLKVLHETLHMERATLYLLNESATRLEIAASYGMTDQEKKRGVYDLNEGVCGKIFRSRYPCVVPDVTNEPLFLNRTKSRPIAKETISFIGVPVLLRNEPAGVLTVDRVFGSEISFEEDVHFITVVATLIAQFLELNKVLQEKEKVLVDENRSLKAELNKRYNRHNIIGQSKIMNDVFVLIDRVAPSKATVLLLGESGTGKELAARAIHNASERAHRPFIKINCAALPENLLESELLGHEKGAFTGATACKRGRFEEADGGSMFLDEIGELPLNLQSKLLRVLQEKEFERLGGNKTFTVDVRLIAATNVNLERAVEKGLFRADLYYRLNVIPVILPPLRERPEDIPLLIDFFLRESNERNGRVLRFSSEMVDFLKNYLWPGNVRELQNLVERLVIMTNSDWGKMSDLPSYMLAEPEKILPAPSPEEGTTSTDTTVKLHKSSLKEMEKEVIESALRRNGWIQARAARELGITQRQIGYRVKQFGITLPTHP